MRVYNKYKDQIPEDSILIDRTTEWGNPFIIGKDGTREQVIFKFKQFVDNSPNFQIRIKESLKNKNLVCSCKPLPCHGDILLQIANEEVDENGIERFL